MEENIDKLHELSNYLLEKETITGEEFMEILNGKSAEEVKEEFDQKEAAEKILTDLEESSNLDEVNIKAETKKIEVKNDTQEVVDLKEINESQDN